MKLFYIDADVTEIFFPDEPRMWYMNFEIFSESKTILRKPGEGHSTGSCPPRYRPVYIFNMTDASSNI